MADSEKPVKRTVKVGMFPYKARVEGRDGKPRIVTLRAERGDTIELIDQADVARGDNNDHFLKPGEKLAAPPRPKETSELGLMDDDELDDLFRNARPTVPALLDAVGGDQELAERVLKAEHDTSDDPRSTLVEALEKIIEGGD